MSVILQELVSQYQRYRVPLREFPRVASHKVSSRSVSTAEEATAVRACRWGVGGSGYGDS